MCGRGTSIFWLKSTVTLLWLSIPNRGKLVGLFFVRKDMKQSKQSTPLCTPSISSQTTLASKIPSFFSQVPIWAANQQSLEPPVFLQSWPKWAVTSHAGHTRQQSSTGFSLVLELQTNYKQAKAHSLFKWNKPRRL